MERRELLKSAMAAGTLAGARLGPFAEPVNAAGAPDGPLVVEGLSAGSIRLSQLNRWPRSGKPVGPAGSPTSSGEIGRAHV